MKLKQVTLAALAGAALLAAAPAFADGYRGDRHDFRGDHTRGDYYRGDHFQRRVVYVQPRHYYYAPRPVFAHRPAVVVRAHSSQDVLGGLIVGAVLGAVIANHAGY